MVSQKNLPGRSTFITPLKFWFMCCADKPRFGKALPLLLTLVVCSKLAVKLLIPFNCLTRFAVACCSDAATGAANTVVLMIGAKVVAPNATAHIVLRSIFIDSPFYICSIAMFWMSHLKPISGANMIENKKFCMLINIKCRNLSIMMKN